MRGHRCSSLVKHSTDIDGVRDLRVWGVPSGEVCRNESVGYVEAQTPCEFDPSGEKFAIDGDLKERNAGCVRSSPGNSMDLKMIGMAVSAVAIVGEEERGAFLGEDLRKRRGRVCDRCSAKGSRRPTAVFRRGMTRVEIVKEDDAGHSEGRCRRFGFGRSTLGECLVCVQDSIADIACTAAGREGENNTVSGLRRPSEGAGIEKGLVVGMGMKGNQGPVGHSCILTGRR